MNFVEGIMLESSKHAETSVYSTGRGTRHDPVRVHSQTSTVQEFWIKKLDGTESQITLHDKEVKAREGHRLVLLRGESEDGLSGYVGYLNIDTDQYVIFNNKGIARAFASKGLPFYATGFLALIVGVFVAFASEFLAGFLIFMVGIWCAIIVRNTHGYFIDPKLTELAKEAVQRAILTNSFTGNPESEFPMEPLGEEPNPWLQN
ncbi:MAG TPA: hypothetical protein DF774_01420 [Rheinheimera sp.]|nr:hypothetical protein [Rheinheimera sp.]